MSNEVTEDKPDKVKPVKGESVSGDIITLSKITTPY